MNKNLTILYQHEPNSMPKDVNKKRYAKYILKSILLYELSVQQKFLQTRTKWIEFLNANKKIFILLKNY